MFNSMHVHSILRFPNQKTPQKEEKTKGNGVQKEIAMRRTICKCGPHFYHIIQYPDHI